MHRIVLLFVMMPVILQAQQVLHYSETSGFDHNTRAASLTMFNDLGAVDGYSVVDDQDGSEFNSLTGLLQYAAVIFSNTSGDAILDSLQRTNFESYINAGGSALGIHAASDTYRHSTANGSNTGSWDFYAELIGASVQQSPNHVAGTPAYAMGHVAVHQSTMSIPDPWVKNEEYYYWESGYLDPSNTVVLEVEQTVGPNGIVNSYDASRPMSWYKQLPSGARVFYTALGHSVNNYQSDSLFIAHIRDAMQWIRMTPNALFDAMGERDWFVTQSGLSLNIHSPVTLEHSTVFTIYSIEGKEICEKQLGRDNTIMLDLPSGIYFISVRSSTAALTKSFYWSN